MHTHLFWGSYLWRELKRIWWYELLNLFRSLWFNTKIWRCLVGVLDVPYSDQLDSLDTTPTTRDWISQHMYHIKSVCLVCPGMIKLVDQHVQHWWGLAWWESRRVQEFKLNLKWVVSFGDEFEFWDFPCVLADSQTARCALYQTGIYQHPNDQEEGAKNDVFMSFFHYEW